ncbi:MAG: DDE-type integrase/transposase/recombinase, partial [Proteobacteria bacterium]|nr:DDE-type integrase/transposase/recombinase [Pseudomonadota bacterium]
MPSPIALFRFTVISAYLATDPPRGQRTALRDALAEKTWTLPDGRQKRFSAETLRTWVRRYREGGLEALDDRDRHRGVRALDPEQVELLCKLKREVPERSVDRVLHIAEAMELLPAGLVSRSTVHRVLQEHGLSKRPVARPKDLDRYEAELPNDTWQSDMMCGPWLPDPDKPGKRRRAWLYAWLDDHSRLLVYGRFAFKQDLPSLELSFRQALRRCGVPKRVYYDNGAVYRSRHMRHVCAELGIHRVVFTTPYRPEGHGKIEAFNRLCRAAFVAEVKASGIETLDALNRAFAAWTERYYNIRVHAEIGVTPKARWRAGVRHVRYVDEAALRRAFQWSEKRTTDKAGVLSLFGRRYQAGHELARKKVEVRFDPEHLEQVELHVDGRFRERVGPLRVGVHRRRKVEVPTEAPGEPTTKWLEHLVEEDEGSWQDPEAELKAAVAEREGQDDSVVAVLQATLAEAVFD